LAVSLTKLDKQFYDKEVMLNVEQGGVMVGILKKT
jgi:hypothetical protein